jgi:hypothetical protein
MQLMKSVSSQVDEGSLAPGSRTITEKIIRESIDETGWEQISDDSRFPTDGLQPAEAEITDLLRCTQHGQGPTLWCARLLARRYSLVKVGCDQPVLV